VEGSGQTYTYMHKTAETRQDKKKHMKGFQEDWQWREGHLLCKDKHKTCAPYLYPPPPMQQNVSLGM